MRKRIFCDDIADGADGRLTQGLGFGQSAGSKTKFYVDVVGCSEMHGLTRGEKSSKVRA